MKTLRILMSSGLLLLSCAAGALAQNVQTNYEDNFNLAKLRTFGFYEQERKEGGSFGCGSANLMCNLWLHLSMR